MLVPNRHASISDYRYGFNSKEKDDEVKGEGNSYDFGSRLLDPRVGRWFTRDPKAALYPGISSYAYALNLPISAIDPDGKLVIFVNGYRPCIPGVNIYREIRRNDKVFKGDKLGYWEGVDKKFMDRMGDHNAIYADGDAPTLTAQNKTGFNARVEHGRQAGQDLISKINSGEVVLQKNDKGEIIESIKVVTHSMGYAYSLGMIEELEKAGYKVEVDYNLAPENPTAKNIPMNVKRSVQYGSGKTDPWYHQDRIATQEDIKNVDENVYIPDKNHNGEDIPKGPYDSHAVGNFGLWIFDLPSYVKGYVEPRKDTKVKPEN